MSLPRRTGRVMSSKTKAELISMLELLEAQEKALSSGKLGTYVPHSGQLAFHRSKKKIRLIVAGNRFGKTQASFMEAVWLALGMHPFKKLPVPNRGKLYGESFSWVEEVLMPKIEQWLPADCLDSRKPFLKNAAGALSGIRFSNGSFIKIGTYDQQEGKAEGSAYHYVAFDEPPPRSLYVANFRGLIDSGGFMWFSMTPLKEAWIFDDLWKPGITGQKDYIECFSGRSDDNPHIDKKTLGMFLDELTEEEREVRFEGKFKRLQGLVIDTYDPDISNVEAFELDEDFSIYEGIDPHARKANAVLWKAVHTSGLRFTVRELSFDGGIYDMGKEMARIRSELEENGARLVRSIADSSLNQTDLGFKINQLDELRRSLREEGEVVMPQIAHKRDWLMPGIQKLRDLFRKVKHENAAILEIVGDKPAPMEYIFPCCTRYKWELTHYQWPDDPLDGAKPIAKHNEYIDCSRYIESLAPRYETMGSSFIRHGEGAYKRKGIGERYGKRD